MRIETVRWLLAPARQWRTRRLMRAHGPTLDYTTAWSLISLARHPDEAGYVRAASLRGNHAACQAPGVYYDDWTLLDERERARRLAWLRRHAVTPISRLGLDARLLSAAGLSVVDWGRPDTGAARAPRDM